MQPLSYADQGAHKNLIANGFQVLQSRSNQVIRYGEVYDRVVYQRQVSDLERITACVGGVLGSLICICCFSKTFIKRCYVPCLDQVEREKKLYKNAQATEDLYQEMERNYSFRPDNRKSLQDYVQSLASKNQLKKAYGHYYYLLDTKAGTGLIVVPFQDVNKVSYFSIYQPENGKSLSTQLSKETSALKILCAYQEIDDKKTVVFKGNGQVLSSYGTGTYSYQPLHLSSSTTGQIEEINRAEITTRKVQKLINQRV